MSFPFLAILAIAGIGVLAAIGYWNLQKARVRARAIKAELAGHPDKAAASNRGKTSSFGRWLDRASTPREQEPLAEQAPATLQAAILQRDDITASEMAKDQQTLIANSIARHRYPLTKPRVKIKKIIEGEFLFDIPHRSTPKSDIELSEQIGFSRAKKINRDADYFPEKVSFPRFDHLEQVEQYRSSLWARDFEYSLRGLKMHLDRLGYRGHQGGGRPLPNTDTDVPLISTEVQSVRIILDEDQDLPLVKESSKDENIPRTDRRRKGS